MEAGEIDSVAPGHRQNQLRGEAAPIDLEESVEGPTEAIVVEKLKVPWGQSERAGAKASAPGGNAVERVTRKGEVADEQQRGVDMGKAQPAVGWSKGALEQGAPAQSVEQCAYNGESSHLQRFEFESFRHPPHRP